MNSHDLDRLCALADPAIEVTLPPSAAAPTGLTFHGHAGLRCLHTAAFAGRPNAEIEFTNVRRGAGGLVAEVSMRVEPRDPQATAERLLVAYAFRDGLLSRIRAFPPTPRFGLRAWIVDEERAARLTRREYEILGLLGDGLTANEVAEALNLSRHTVRTHVQNAKERLGVRTVTHAAAIVARAARLSD
jgi:DNA-binding CsgD family transcriptional regulator